MSPGMPRMCHKHPAHRTARRVGPCGQQGHPRLPRGCHEHRALWTALASRNTAQVSRTTSPLAETAFTNAVGDP
eukprot:11090834-Alexandrium_andersonii.AAC.1